jgi:hypothetical protein
MHLRLSFFLTALVISAGPSAAMSQSDLTAPHFTLQVASFPDIAQAGRFAAGLVTAGEHPVFDTVEIEGRGYWTRVFLGLFDTTDAARRHGVTLVAREVIKEFLVKKTGLNQAVTRPRRVAGSDSQVPPYTGSSALVTKAVLDDRTVFGSFANPASGMRTETTPVNNGRGFPQKVLRDHVSTPLPIVEAAAFRLAPTVDTNLIPRPNPVDLAFRLVAGEPRDSPGSAWPRGGLWIGGDTAEGLARLRWIVGEENVGLIKLDADGRVKLDKRLLARVAGLRETRVEDPLRAVDYISSDEGLLLLVQVAQGRYRYLLHIGRQSPTSGKSVETAGSINLDNNVDSRINPYRKNGKKLDGERPPEGFDSLMGLNPVARWFNLSTNGWVQAGEIVFHEIAEAYAKLEFGLDYLDQGSRPGAHSVALERELRLKSQRPGVDIVMTAGSNRLLRTEEEIRLFYAEAGAGSSQR